MRISAKSRYGLASMITLATFQDQKAVKTIASIAHELQLSKIYLEQVFSLLKKNQLVKSLKGPQGGYYLAKEPKEITVYDILFAMENNMFEDHKPLLQHEGIEFVLMNEILDPLDSKMKDHLESLTLHFLVEQVNLQGNDDGFMYYL